MICPVILGRIVAQRSVAVIGRILQYALVELLLGDLHHILPVDGLLDIGIRPLIRDRTFTVLESSELLVPLLLLLAFSKMHGSAGSCGNVDQGVCTILTDLLIYSHCFVDGSGRYFRCSLCQMRKSRMAGIPEQDRLFVYPEGSNILLTLGQKSPNTSIICGLLPLVVVNLFARDWTPCLSVPVAPDRVACLPASA
ncbi:hypothetical protein KC336_g73 [Hortaea werneckii]|nr:hypothetical protein KC336_g73 [Hortaea werneckii]